MTSTTDWILSHRPAVERPEPGAKLLGKLDEWEAAAPHGPPVRVRTLFLRGSECRFRCAMCDLWQHTYVGTTPAGDIPQQIQEGLQDLADQPTPPRWLKLYNASNFFDARNVPPQDLPIIAQLVSGMERVVVECHPRLLRTSELESFAAQVKPAQLELAMGLETVHPEVLKSLNKQMTVDDYRRAVDDCRQLGISVRAFVLLQPPWLDRPAAMHWCQAAIDWAVGKGVGHVCIIPVRGGNGAMEQLEKVGQFTPPSADMLERVLADNLTKDDCLVTVDLWDWHRLKGTCAACSEPRRTRLQSMNLHRQHVAAIDCEKCDGA